MVTASILPTYYAPFFYRKETQLAIHAIKRHIEGHSYKPQGES